MFSKLTELAYKRSAKEAFGFYLAYLLVFILAGMIIGMMWADGSKGFSAALLAGAKIASLLALFLSFLIIRAKKIISFKYLLIAIISGILAYVGGGLLGLIPIAYLTTREPKSVGV